MNTKLVTLELPGVLYQQLQALATAEDTDIASFIAQMVADAYQRKSWLKDLNTLRQLLKEDGGLQLGDSKEEVIERLLQRKQEIFDRESAHQYGQSGTTGDDFGVPQSNDLNSIVFEESMILSDRDRDIVLSTLANPPELNKNLKSAIRRFRKKYAK